MKSIMQCETGLFYTAEKNKLILLSLLKKYNINNIVVSPGATNVTFVASLQHDNYFNMYSCVDERSASYMAIGIAIETKRPVVLSCTGATSSRNYYPGLTEAYYRGVPILVVTSSLSTEFVGHDYPQMTDRENAPFDVVRRTFVMQNVKDDNDYWDCVIKANRALNALYSDNAGPVHINLETEYSPDFSIKELPDVREIRVLRINDKFPDIIHSNVAIFIGSHKKFSTDLQKSIESFCENYNAVVLCDNTSNYYGKYKLNMALLYAQEAYFNTTKFDLIIYLGDITGDYYTSRALFNGELWRVSTDGEIKDRFRNTKYVFKMTDDLFFKHYWKQNSVQPRCTHFEYLKNELNKIKSNIKNIPFSNIWLAKEIAPRIPEGASIHFGILNSLRAWNFFELPNRVTSFCNVGGFGIDGCLSSLIGASMVDAKKLYFGIFGDLSFFYDMNVLRNSPLGCNLRILVVNNGCGTEFRNYNHSAAILGKAADPYVAAAGHFGQKSRTTIKMYVESCGFDYLSASNKEEFNTNVSKFISDLPNCKPLVFEVFTDSACESDALKQISNTIQSRHKKSLFKMKSFLYKLIK